MAKKSYPTNKAKFKTRGFRHRNYGVQTQLEYWQLLGRGNSKLEKAIDAVARSVGIFFDAYQYYVPLTLMTATVLDFAIFHPRTAIFADGWHHQNRADTEHEDVVRRMELEAMGWKVIAITEEEFNQDPTGAVLKIKYS